MPKCRLYHVNFNTTVFLEDGKPVDEEALRNDVLESHRKIMKAPWTTWMHFTGTVADDPRKES